MSDGQVSPERTVACPQCGGTSLFSPRNAFRPFCSQRCKVGDLGRWASEDFRVPEATPPDTGPDQNINEISVQRSI